MLVRFRQALQTAHLCGHDVGGSVLPLAAFMLPILVLLVGGGVEASRAYQVKSRLQYACDAAVLAGRKESSGTGTDSDGDGLLNRAETAANNYFNANFDEAEEGVAEVSFTPSTEDDGNTVDGNATVELDTALLHVVGFDSFEMETTCSASMSMANSDIIMVLDVTGSMACTAAMSSSQCSNYIGDYGYSETAHGSTSRLQNLEDAMKGFYDTIDASREGTNARIRIGFVPYSSTVNVGYLLPSSYLADSITIPSRTPEFETVTSTEWEDPVYDDDTGYSDITYGNVSTYTSTQYNNQSSCLSALPANVSYQNNGDSDTDTETEINDAGQRVTTTTITQPQRATQYSCIKNSNNSKWRRYRQYLYRDYYEYEIATQDPITVTETEFASWTYEDRTLDTSNYKLGVATTLNIGTDGADQSFTWSGCIMERATVSEASFSYSSLLGITPSGAQDLDIDTAPDSSDPDTQWAPLWVNAAYYRTAWVSSWRGGYWDVTDAATSENGSRATANCPHNAALLADLDEDDFDDYAEALVPTGSTYHDIGMVWGGRLLSPTGIFASNVNEEAENGGSVARHIIFMTDGQMQPSSTAYSAQGIEWHQRRVTDNGSTGLTDRHNSRFAAACEAIKAKGIRIWVIAFSTGLNTTLDNCASNDSSFSASNYTGLNNAFQAIANEVGELRITN